MAGITLAQAQQNLADSLTALDRARRSTAYNVADRSLQRDKVEALQKQVGVWERKVRELAAAQSGATSPGLIFPSFH